MPPPSLRSRIANLRTELTNLERIKTNLSDYRTKKSSEWWRSDDEWRGGSKKTTAFELTRKYEACLAALYNQVDDTVSCSLGKVAACPEKPLPLNAVLKTEGAGKYLFYEQNRSFLAYCHFALKEYIRLEDCFTRETTVERVARKAADAPLYGAGGEASATSAEAPDVAADLARLILEDIEPLKETLAAARAAAEAYSLDRERDLADQRRMFEEQTRDLKAQMEAQRKVFEEQTRSLEAQMATSKSTFEEGAESVKTQMEAAVRAILASKEEQTLSLTTQMETWRPIFAEGVQRMEAQMEATEQAMLASKEEVNVLRRALEATQTELAELRREMAEVKSAQAGVVTAAATLQSISTTSTKVTGRLAALHTGLEKTKRQLELYQGQARATAAYISRSGPGFHASTGGGGGGTEVAASGATATATTESTPAGGGATAITDDRPPRGPHYSSMQVEM